MAQIGRQRNQMPWRWLLLSVTGAALILASSSTGQTHPTRDTGKLPNRPILSPATPTKPKKPVEPAQGRGCGTDAYREYLERMGIEAPRGLSSGGGCVVYDCDNPAVRNRYIPTGNLAEWKTFQLKVNVFREDNGTNAAETQSTISQQMATVNLAFAPHQIKFEYEVEFIDDSGFRVISSWTESRAMKNAYADDPANQINVYVTGFAGQLNGLCGFALYPTSSQALDNGGGSVVRDSCFGGGQTTLIHELGHNLGLRHTFHGVSEQSQQCGPCWERADGVDADITGDFCSDTSATPKNFACADPGGTDPCSGVEWGETEPENYMSYASCASEFSPQQAGRMHCFAEQFLPNWFEIEYLCDTPLRAGVSGELTQVDPQTDNELGCAVAVSEDVMVVGIRNYVDVNTPGSYDGTGAVQFYRFNGASWLPEGDPITPPELPGIPPEYFPRIGGRFGEAVDIYADPINGDYAVIGGRQNDVVYQDPETGDWFSINDCGLAFVYRYDSDKLTWAHEQTLQLPIEVGATNPPHVQQSFGESVTIDPVGGAILVGATGDHGDLTNAGEYVYNSGSVYIFEYDPDFDPDSEECNTPWCVRTWFRQASVGDGQGGGTQLIETAALRVPPLIELPPGPTQGAAFGYTIAVQEEYLVIGAYQDDVLIRRLFPQNQGSAYVFRRAVDPDEIDAPWEFEALLQADDATEDDEFGHDVDIDNGVIVVGAHRREAKGGGLRGGVYTFLTDDLEAGHLPPLEPDIPDIPGNVDMAFFGHAVALANDQLIVGAPLEAHTTDVDGDGIPETSVSGAGATYLYTSDGAGGWIFDDKQIMGPPEAFAWLGFDVAADGSTIASGALRADYQGLIDDSGAVFAVGGAGGEDCNCNGIWDCEDILAGTSNDCNLNGVPDECEWDPTLNGCTALLPKTCDVEILNYTRKSDPLGPVGVTGGPPNPYVQYDPAWSLDFPPPAADDGSGTMVVEISVAASADLGTTGRVLHVFLNNTCLTDGTYTDPMTGQPIVALFDYNAPSCATTDLPTETFNLPVADYNAILLNSNGPISLVIAARNPTGPTIPNQAVDPFLCLPQETFVVASISYLPDFDCDGDCTFDPCQIAESTIDGVPQLDLNLNSILDLCESISPSDLDRACCFGDVCRVLPMPECSAQGGTPLSGFADCTLIPCENGPVNVPCCVNGICEIISTTECLARCGTPQPTGTTCDSSVLCPPPCPADLDCDGIVGPLDVSIMAVQWGQCAPPDLCTADISGPLGIPDGFVDTFDLTAMFIAIGPCP